ncbi:MAG: hypothetical protein WCR42_09080 [bacterium]
MLAITSSIDMEPVRIAGQASSAQVKNRAYGLPLRVYDVANDQIGAEVNCGSIDFDDMGVFSFVWNSSITYNQLYTIKISLTSNGLVIFESRIDKLVIAQTQYGAFVDPVEINGTPTAGEILTSNGTTAYWASPIPALGTGDLVSTTNGVIISGGIGAVIGSGTAIDIETADATTTGLISNIDWTIFNAKITNATHTGDVSGSGLLTLATVNTDLSTYNNVTINAKGLAIAGSNVAYLTSFTESDPFFTAWDKSTGISIISSQVSDFGTSVANNSAVLANTAKITNADHTGDVSGSGLLTLATVNADLGTYNNVTINAKGLAIAGSNIAYLTSVTEADPIFIGWNKSTGISITSSQVSDFGASVTNNSAVLANTAKITNADHTGDVSGSDLLTLATVNTTTPGVYGTSTAVPTIIVNGKGLVTASSSTSIAFPVTFAGTEDLTNKTYNGYTLPAVNAGDNNKVLSTDGTGGRSWTTPSGCSAASYAYCYDSVGGTLSANTDIVLNSNGVMSNITHTEGETGITVTTAGVYKIDYGINVNNNIGVALAISINDVVEESSRIYFVSAFSKLC